MRRRSSDGDDDLSALLATAREEAGTALDDLRHLAQGIYPAVLTEAGLGPALATLAETAALAVELADVSASRFPTAVETAAYATIAEAIEDASARGATFVTVATSHEDDGLVIAVEDDGEERAAPLDAGGRSCRGDRRLDGCRPDEPPRGAAMRVIVADDDLLTRQGHRPSAPGRGRRGGRRGGRRRRASWPRCASTVRMR